jgi:HK97 family phage major capsid protein
MPAATPYTKKYLADLRAKHSQGIPHIQVSDPIERDPMRCFQSPHEFFTAVINHRLSIPPTQAQGKLQNWASYCAAHDTQLVATAGSDEQSTFNTTMGGFLVPAGMLPDSLLAVKNSDPFAGRTTNVSMEYPRVYMPFRVDKDHSDSVSSGLKWHRREEAAAALASRAKIGLFEFLVNKLVGLSFVTQELMNDSRRTVAALLQTGFQTELSSTLVAERLHGTGVGEYKGIMSSGALITIDKESGQAAKTILFENLLKMAARCWGYDDDAVWIANPDCRAAIMLINKTVGVPVWVPRATEDGTDMLLGRPLFFTEHAETLGTQGDLVLCNPAEYIEGVYEPLQTVESVFVRFEEHENALKFWIRNCGAPWWDSVLTPTNGTDTLSPFICLAERS